MQPVFYMEKSNKALIEIQLEEGDTRAMLERAIPVFAQLLTPNAIKNAAQLPICPHCGVQPCELKMHPSFVAPQFLVGVTTCQGCKKIVGTVLLGNKPGPRDAGMPA